MMDQSHLLYKIRKKEVFIYSSIFFLLILLNFQPVNIAVVYAGSSFDSTSGTDLGNISVKVIPARVNSTRDLDDKEPGDGECFTGEKNSYGEPECTLRAFIQEANERKGTNIIRIFDIPLNDPGYNRDTHIHTIRPQKPLPVITDAVEIEGCVRSSRGCLPSIELDGSKAGSGVDGLVIQAGFSTVSGLIINNFKGAGIRLSLKGSNTIVGNYIGTDYEGTAAMPNAQGGVIIENSSYNEIGGSHKEDLNLISGNGVAGVLIKGKASKNNQIFGNYIGTDINGDCKRDAGGECLKDASIGNLTGIFIADAGDNDIADNLISGNGLHGIALYHSPENKILGNHIGVVENGTKANPNGKTGIYLKDSPRNRIGGTKKGIGNVISGNKEAGIRISGENARQNVIFGNFIGVGKYGDTELQNEGDGILIESAPDNRIGGTEEGSGNTISGNAGSGVKIIEPKAEDNKVQGNNIGTSSGGKWLIPIPNEKYGVHIEEAAKNLIGGTEENAGNLVSANRLSGVFITGKAAKLNKIKGNHIGTSKDGNSHLGNEENGVYIENAPENLIGGIQRGSGNLISCNDVGVFISGAEAAGNKVLGNIIGPRKDGKTILEVGVTRITENSSYFKTGNDIGVWIQAPDNIVGSANGRNVISGNSGEGIIITVLIPDPEVVDVITKEGLEKVVIWHNDLNDWQEIAYGNKIYNNFIGVDMDGKRSLPNGQNGIAILSASNNFIGGTGAGMGNVISGNKGSGIYIVNHNSTENKFAGNRIGTDADAFYAIPNEVGIEIVSSDNNFVGVPGGRNYISGNHKQGVLINFGAENNYVQGNFIGVDFNGTSKLPNETGIEVRSSSGNTIGGSGKATRNVISGNKDCGILLKGWDKKGGNFVYGNFIGMDAKGIAKLGNGEDGIRIQNSDNIIGSNPEHDFKQRVGEQNTIAHNGGAGVYALEARNRISRNRIFGNTDDGINLTRKLHGSGPILDSVRTQANSRIMIKGQFFMGDPLRTGDTFLVQFFSSPQCEPRKGEGANYIGEDEVTLRRHPYNFSFRSRRPVPKGQFITATSYTRRLGTSEFSNCLEVK